MGGSYGGGISTSDISNLEGKAKKSLAEAGDDKKRHVFISFSIEDINDVNLLRGQENNSNTNLQFDDYSVKDPYDSNNADYIKRNIRDKIDKCSVTVVYLSTDAANSKWVNWEIEESLKRGKGVIGVYKGNTPPAQNPPAFSKNGCQAVKWEHAALMKAIEDASTKR